MKLDIYKIGSSGFCQFGGEQRLFPWSTYQVTVHAPEFASLSGVATLSLLHDTDTAKSVVFATCQLVTDTLRRDVRTGTLVIGDSGHASLFDTLFSGSSSRTDDGFTLHVTAGPSSDTIICQRVPLQWIPRVVQSGGGSGGGSSSSWVVVNGVITGGKFPVEDMSQTSFDVTSHTSSVDILPKASGVPATGPFEAYVSFTVNGAWSTSRLITVNGSSVVWDYEDSVLLESSVWTAHIFKVGSVWHGTFRANDVPPAGTEEDSDSDLVPGTGVN